MNFSINYNSQAQSILSNLNSVEQNVSNSYAQLSTGNRINSASNDPAGYAISQQMQSQVNGLNQSTQNSQDMISLLQTATGAQNQVESILQTMSNLATESSSAGLTYSDRANLQLEMNSLAQQINSITNQTQYNGINLLTGQYGAGQTALTAQIGANQGQTLTFNIGASDAQTIGVAGQQATGGNVVISSATVNGSGIIANTQTSAGVQSQTNFASDALASSGSAVSSSSGVAVGSAAIATSA